MTQQASIARIQMDASYRRYRGTVSRNTQLEWMESTMVNLALATNGHTVEISAVCAANLMRLGAQTVECEVSEWNESQGSFIPANGRALALPEGISPSLLF